jgi:hypothetical protein
VPSNEGGAEAGRSANRWPERWRPYSRWACRGTGARTGAASALSSEDSRRRVVKRHPRSDKRCAVGAGGVVGAKGERHGPHGHVGGAGRCQEGGVGLKGGGELQAKPAGAQGEGELGDLRVRLHGSARRVLHQVEGGEKQLPFGGSDVGGESRPRGDAGEVGQARLQGGAEQEELVLPAQGKGGEGSDQASDGLGPGASVNLDKCVRAEGRAGSHKPLWTMGNTQGGGNG